MPLALHVLGKVARFASPARNHVSWGERGVVELCDNSWVHVYSDEEEDFYQFNLETHPAEVLIFSSCGLLKALVYNKLMRQVAETWEEKQQLPSEMVVVFQDDKWTIFEFEGKGMVPPAQRPTYRGVADVLIEKHTLLHVLL